ncbi:protein of unknown function [Micromonospora coriariae]|uniref:DUF3291 domain-containing protein n=1 Tax=Micromonospora coriariae TaxID=285665 RepID=A0A1C4XCH2_9ACTN|nr:DUF3291 domain-containing protein [Micromonospora coriariae]SCF06229.1 protein of unknown function [Micromonospora coriariae]
MADRFHLAQVNVALPDDTADKNALDSFFALSDLVNEAADSAPGFIWRPQTPLPNPCLLGVDGLLVTMSVWRTVDDLRHFIFHGVHAGALRRRREWFRDLPEAHMALWWIPAGRKPGLAEGEERLLHVREHGPSPYAFHLGKTYPPPVRMPGSSPPQVT